MKMNFHTPHHIPATIAVFVTFVWTSPAPYLTFVELEYETTYDNPHNGNQYIGEGNWWRLGSDDRCHFIVYFGLPILRKFASKNLLQTSVLRNSATWPGSSAFWDSCVEVVISEPTLWLSPICGSVLDVFVGSSGFSTLEDTAPIAFWSSSWIRDSDTVDLLVSLCSSSLFGNTTDTGRVDFSRLKPSSYGSEAYCVVLHSSSSLKLCFAIPGCRHQNRFDSFVWPLDGDRETPIY